MKKKILYTCRCVLVVALLSAAHESFAGNGNPVGDDKNMPGLLSNPANAPIIRRMADSIYDLISLGQYGLEREVFFSAYKGYQYLLNKGMLRRTNLLTICDYSQSCNNKRLYVVDVVESRLLYNTFVSHGKNSGNEFATSFSNSVNSNKSSLGFMVTGSTYRGKAGYSLQFNGVEPGINDHVKSRAIVLHGSRFVNEGVMNIRGIIGRSYGCPAVPLGMHKQIIDAIKGGSCFFINSPDLWYASSSKILNAPFDLSPVMLAGNLATQGTPADATAK